jgi:hypothetical protein
LATTIVTGVWGPAGQSYCQTFMDSFDRYWPGDVGLQIWSDRPIIAPRGALRDLGQTDGWQAFCDRHKDEKFANGREPDRLRWKPSAIAGGYNFRFDAVRFAGQAFVPEAASKELPDGDILAWFDADVETFAKVPEQWLEGILGKHPGAYLGRGAKHSEIGFWAVRLNPETRRMLKAFADLYRSDALFGLKEWHSAWLWDYARRETITVPLLDLTPNGSGHVWFDPRSPLKAYTDHRKGQRKVAGRSKERGR